MNNVRALSSMWHRRVCYRACYRRRSCHYCIYLKISLRNVIYRAIARNEEIKKGNVTTISPSKYYYPITLIK